MSREKKPTAAEKAARSAIFDNEGKPKPGVQRVLERAVDVQRPAVLSNIRRLRKKHPDASAAELSKKLERSYLAAVTTSGAAVGATAAVPAVGTVAALGLSGVAVVGFLEATALYAQSIAELHGVQTADPERAKTLVMAVLLGEEGSALMQTLSGSSGHATQHWGNVLGSSMPSGMMGGIGRQIRSRFLKKFLAKQGTAMLGRVIPFGIGAAVGGAGNHLMGKAVIRSTREAFGPAPETIPGELLHDLNAPIERFRE
ncbi:hypothetical protein [Arthrobacter roseus]|uniref:hypothetical protein n=1 Tax=Arthrobacter roseus TaxID=136274 RepID=UPI001964A24A|nr:hypothetical protein [Arthrobacter roseus]MBM7847325.1 hypothetical protein [Arthrobacter roseus]